MQQYLPLAVLKPSNNSPLENNKDNVATVLTACGIETLIEIVATVITAQIVATVLTACGIETLSFTYDNLCSWRDVATVLTACGIETPLTNSTSSPSRILLHVATVLTACGIETSRISPTPVNTSAVATVLTACGIETRLMSWI